ncbi:MAG: hypothetical protein EBY31_04480 [Flavobacteriia bacterium]|nr:hypothetical protein [Flavobacteriia bacterium]
MSPPPVPPPPPATIITVPFNEIEEAPPPAYESFKTFEFCPAPPPPKVGNIPIPVPPTCTVTMSPGLTKIFPVIVAPKPPAVPPPLAPLTETAILVTQGGTVHV